MLVNVLEEYFDEWVARVMVHYRWHYPRSAEFASNTWAGDGEVATFPESTAFAQFVLKEMTCTYKPYVLGNAQAQRAGAKAFHFETYGEDTSYLSRPDPELSRTMIAARIDRQLTAGEREVVGNWLRVVGLDECFLTVL